jgi:hypothetical protein
MFTFSNPLLLWAFPILVLPWIFRRRQEERIRRVDFPLLRFLLESEDKELVNPQLQELLLLILRTLILAMLLLSLAGPRWVTDTGLNNRFLSFLPFGQTFTTNVIALDTSYSMGYGEGTDSWWNRAERTVNQLQGELTGFSTQWVNWDVTITQTGNTGRILPMSAAQLEAIWQELPREAGSTVLELQQALGGMLQGNEKLVVLTDGQRHPWAELLDQRGVRYDIDPMLVVTVGKEPVVNSWIQIDTLSSPPWGIASWETIAGKVFSIRPDPVESASISIIRQDTDEVVYTEPLALPASSQQAAQLPFIFSTRFSSIVGSSASTGNLNFTLQLNPTDPLPIDDELILEVPAVDSFTVGIWGDTGQPLPPIQSVLTAAFSPGTTGAGSPVGIQPVGPQGGLTQEMNLVLLSRQLVPWWIGMHTTEVMEYVRNGGSLVIFTGNVEPEDEIWNQLLNNLGWRWQENQPAGNADSVSVTASGFLEQALSAWDENIWKEWIPTRHGELPGQQAQSLITYTIGEAVFDLIVHQQLGEGSVWVVNTTLALEGNTFLSPALPAFLWEAAKEVARENAELIMELPQAKQESNLNLLTEEEKQFLEENYQITFATPETLPEAIAKSYGGTDLRMLLLFGVIILALIESWLANRLASL